MPQMAPMGWISLYLLYILIFFIFIIMNYFTFLSPPLNQKLLKKKKLFYWKW